MQEHQVIKLVEIRQAQCFPSLRYKNSTKKYFRSLNDMLVINEYYPHRWTIETLILTECYLNHVDSFKRILVIDQDEIIFPRKFQNSYPIRNDLSYLDYSKGADLLTQDFTEKCNSNDRNLLNAYGERIISDLKLGKNSNLHFKMGFYLTSTFFDHIFSKLSEFYNVYKTNTPASVLVKDEEQSNFLKRDIIYNFTMSNMTEFDYGLNLTKFYTSSIKPYIQNKKQIIENKIHSTHFRFFYFHGKSVEYYWGKTMHNTMKTLYLSHHYPIDSSSGSAQIPQDIGHVSHFRYRYVFNSAPISITDLKFDLNYFACFFKPNLKILMNS